MISRPVASGLGWLQLFIGVGAVGGGMVLISDPTGARLGIPLTELEYSPFATYLIPGVVLFVVNGVGSLVGAAMSFRRHRYAGYLAIALGAFLIGWIIVQVYWLSSFHWLQGLYLGLGIIESVLGLIQRQSSKEAA